MAQHSIPKKRINLFRGHACDDLKNIGDFGDFSDIRNVINVGDVFLAGKGASPLLQPHARIWRNSKRKQVRVGGSRLVDVMEQQGGRKSALCLFAPRAAIRVLDRVIRIACAVRPVFTALPVPPVPPSSTQTAP